MIHPSSLPTLIVASRLSRRADRGGDGGNGAAVDEMLRAASFVLAATFYVPGLLDSMEKGRADGSRDDREDSEDSEEQTMRPRPVVEKCNKRALRRVKRSRLSEFDRMCRVRLKVSSRKRTPKGDAEGEPPRISTRRQRRARYSDFFENELARQIEAMALMIEGAYKNRHVKKSKYVIDIEQHTFTMAEHLMMKGVGLTLNSSSAKKTLFQDKASRLVEGTGGKPPTNSVPFLRHRHKKTTKNIKEAPRYRLLHRALQIIPETEENVPTVEPCDSQGSLSSNSSMNSRSTSDSLSLSLAEKSWKSSLSEVAGTRSHLSGLGFFFR